VPYEVNTLGGDITATEVTSVRNGQVAKNTTWKRVKGDDHALDSELGSSYGFHGTIRRS